jgi:uncharacterized membrane protein YvbJ
MKELSTQDLNKIKTILRKVDHNQPINNQPVEVLLAYAIKELYTKNIELEKNIQSLELKLKRTTN